MSLLLEALKKAALEKRNRGETEEPIGPMPTSAAPEPSEDAQRRAVSRASAAFLAKQQSRAARRADTAPADEAEADPRVEPAAVSQPEHADEHEHAEDLDLDLHLPHEEPAHDDEEPSAVLDEEPSAVFHEEPSAALEEEPSAVLEEEPSAAFHEEPSAVLNEEPSAVLEEEPPADLHREPLAFSSEEPAEAPETPVEEPSAEAPPPESDSAEEKRAAQRNALQRLVEKSRQVDRDSHRRSAIMYAGLIITSLGAIGFYYYVLAKNQGGVMPPVTPAPEVIPVVAETIGMNASDPVETAAAPAEVPQQEPAPVEETPVPADLEERVAVVVASEPPAAARAVETSESSPRLIIERRETPRPVIRTVNRAYEAYRSGDLETASRLYSEALAQSPRQRDALLGAAAIAVQQGRWQDALRLYQRRLTDDSRDQYARAGLLALAGQGATGPELQSEVKLLLEDHPREAHLHFLLGSLQAASGLWADAQKAFFEARTWDRDNPDYAYNLAVSLDHLRKPRQALDQYRQALALASYSKPGFDVELVRRRVEELEGRGQ